MEAVLQSREKEAGSPVMAGSDYTSAGVFISGFLLCERIYHPVWVLVTKQPEAVPNTALGSNPGPP